MSESERMSSVHVKLCSDTMLMTNYSLARVH